MGWKVAFSISFAVNIIQSVLAASFIDSVKRRRDRKEREQDYLERLKIKLEKYNEKMSTVRIDFMRGGNFSDKDTQDTLQESESIFEGIEADLIYCPEEIRLKVNEFKKLSEKASQELFAQQLNGFHKNPEIITDVVKQVEERYSGLLVGINKFLKNQGMLWGFLKGQR